MVLAELRRHDVLASEHGQPVPDRGHQRQRSEHQPRAVPHEEPAGGREQDSGDAPPDEKYGVAERGFRSPRLDASVIGTEVGMALRDEQDERRGDCDDHEHSGRVGKVDAEPSHITIAPGTSTPAHGSILLLILSRWGREDVPIAPGTEPHDDGTAEG